MVGYPDPFTPGCKYDYDVYKSVAPVEKWRAAFENLLNERYKWFNTGVLANAADGIVDDTHKVVSEEQQNQDGTEGTKTVHYQYELQEDPVSDFCRFGFTEDEVVDILVSADAE